MARAGTRGRRGRAFAAGRRATGPGTALPAGRNRPPWATSGRPRRSPPREGLEGSPSRSLWPGCA
eukprot:6306430-Lingulodinium_polyedra.AAC.1